jgi:hypothetical protein
MWAHYADNCNGLCAEYSFQKVIYDIPSVRCDNYGKYLLEHCFKVKYVEEVKSIIKLDCDKLLKIPLNDIDNNKYVISNVIKSLTRKQKQWGYEKEYRIILRNNDNNIDIIANNSAGFKIKFPYISNLYYCIYVKKQKKDKINVLANALNIKSNMLKPSADLRQFVVVNNGLNSKNLKDKLPEFHYDIDDIPF